MDRRTSGIHLPMPRRLSQLEPSFDQWLETMRDWHSDEPNNAHWIYVALWNIRDEHEREVRRRRPLRRLALRRGPTKRELAYAAADELFERKSRTLCEWYRRDYLPRDAAFRAIQVANVIWDRS